MGEDEPGYRGCSEHIPIELWSRKSKRWKISIGSKTDCSDSLNGRLTGVHKVLCSVAEIACKGRQDFYLGHDGGCMIPIHSKIVRE